MQISDELMHCAKEFEKEKGIHFGYYCLISGQDYPIRNVSSIRDELQNSYPKPYIDCTPCAKGNWVYNGSSNSAWWNSVSAKINRWLPKPSLMRKLVKCPIFVANLLTSRQMNPRVLLEKNTLICMAVQRGGYFLIKWLIICWRLLGTSSEATNSIL